MGPRPWLARARRTPGLQSSGLAAEHGRPATAPRKPHVTFPPVAVRVSRTRRGRRVSAPSARMRIAAAVAAALACVVAAVLAAARLDGYSHLLHPLGLLGARQLGGAGLAFGLAAYVAPGLAQAWQVLRLRAGLPPGSRLLAGIGLQLLLVGALAFAAQGLLRLDLEALDAGASRWHALAWLAWVLGFVLGGGALALGLRGVRGAGRLAPVSLGAAVLVLAGAFLLGDWIGPALAQRLAILGWLGWGVAAAAQPRLGTDG